MEPTYFAAVCVSCCVFRTTQVKVHLPLIKIDFGYFKLVCRAMWWIQAIYMELQRLTIYAFIAL